MCIRGSLTGMAHEPRGDGTRTEDPPTYDTRRRHRTFPFSGTRPRSGVKPARPHDGWPTADVQDRGRVVVGRTVGRVAPRRVVPASPAIAARSNLPRRRLSLHFDRHGLLRRGARGEARDHAGDVGGSPVLAQLALRVQPRDPQLHADDRLELALDVVRGRVVYGPAVRPPGLMAVREAPNDVQEPRRVVADLESPVGLDRRVIPGGDVTPGPSRGLVEPG